MPRKKSQSIESMFAEMDEILNKMQDDEVSFDDSMSLYKKGLELAMQCSKQINSAEEEVKVLIRNFDNEFVLNNFDEEEE